jgi:hypothetical protein
MSWFVRKILLVAGALAIAALVTCLPWFVLFNYEGEGNQLFGFTAILWAPLALIVGVVAGAAFAYVFWPRNR